MNIAIHDADGGKFPNLALLKLTAWHKSQGNDVEPYNALLRNGYDRVYSSRVFSFSDDDPYLPEDTIRGGTGYGASDILPEEVEHTCPDYTDMDYSMGFLTRGCNRSCDWCVVPDKEGTIRPHTDIEEFARHRDVVLLDNNILAHPHGVGQLEKIATMDIKIDLNQGIDARLIDDQIARLLGKVKWIRFVRLACDHSSQIPVIRKVIERLRWNNIRQIACYVLIKDSLEDAIDRVRVLKGMGVDPFCQPFISLAGTPPPDQHRHFARWVNNKAVFRSCTWETYRKNKAQPLNNSGPLNKGGTLFF